MIQDARQNETAAADCDCARETLWTLGAGLLVALFCLTLVLHTNQWFWQDDFQSYQLANYYDVARAWQSGEAPLLSPYSWQCGALAGEYQNGVFSLAITGLVLLIFSTSMSLTAAGTVLSISHLAILAMGTFRLSRRLGTPRDLALVAALATALSGWIMIWGAKAWFPALAAFAWLPWFWWGLDRSLDTNNSTARFLPAGFFLYLIITAGWPFTVLMAALLTVWSVLRHRALHGGWLASWPIVGAWVIGLGLSAPAWMMLLEYTKETVRGQTPAKHLSDHWTVPAAGLPGLVLPSQCVTWNVYSRFKPHMSAELAGGLVPLAFLLTAFATGGRSVFRKFGWEIGLCVLVLALAMLPSPGNFRWSYRWLPFFSLILAVLGAQAMANARLSGNLNPGTWATLLVGAACVMTLCAVWEQPTITLIHASILAAMCFAWAIADWRMPFIATWIAPAVVLVSSWLTFAPIAPFLEVPWWNPNMAQNPAGLDPNVRYLSVHIWPDIFEDRPSCPERALDPADGAVVPGNFGTYAGIEFINGYSPMGPLDLFVLFNFGTHGYLGGPHQPMENERVQMAVDLIVAESGPNDLLALMGVDGLMIADRFARVIPRLESRGWQRTATLPGTTVLHRTIPSKQTARSIETAIPLGDWWQSLELIRQRKMLDLGVILFEGNGPPDEAAPARDFARAQVKVRQESRNKVVVEVTNPTPGQESLVAFSRPWFPGYGATFNGRPIPLSRANLILPAVRLPHGESGELVLEYRPDSLVRGGKTAAATILLSLLLSILALRRSRTAA